MVGVNIGVAAPMAYFPFGGARDSFFGDLKVHGRDAFEFYTDKKVTISRWSELLDALHSREPVIVGPSFTRHMPDMPRKSRGLIQAAAPLTDPAAPIAEVREAAIDAHIPLIEEAGTTRRADPRPAGDVQRPVLLSVAGSALVRHRRARARPDHRADGGIREASTRWRWSCPSTSASRPASTTTPPPSTTPTARYLGKYRKNHIPHTSGFWEKYFFKPGNLGYPVFQTRYATIGVYICYDRHFPEGARLLGLNGAEIVFNPSATVAGLSQYLWKLEQPAHAVANGYFMACSNRVGTEAPWNIGRFYGSSYFVDPRGNFLADGVRGRRRAHHRRARPRHDRRGPARLAVLPRSPARDLRADGGAAAVSVLIKNGTIVTADRSLHAATSSSRASASRRSARR